MITLLMCTVYAHVKPIPDTKNAYYQVDPFLATSYAQSPEKAQEYIDGLKNEPVDTQKGLSWTIHNEVFGDFQVKAYQQKGENLLVDCENQSSKARYWVLLAKSSAEFLTKQKERVKKGIADLCGMCLKNAPMMKDERKALLQSRKPKTSNESKGMGSLLLNTSYFSGSKEISSQPPVVTETVEPSLSAAADEQQVPLVSGENKNDIESESSIHDPKVDEVASTVCETNGLCPAPQPPVSEAVAEIESVLPTGSEGHSSHHCENGEDAGDSVAHQPTDPEGDSTEHPFEDVPADDDAASTKSSGSSKNAEGRASPTGSEEHGEEQPDDGNGADGAESDQESSTSSSSAKHSEEEAPPPQEEAKTDGSQSSGAGENKSFVDVSAEEAGGDAVPSTVLEPASPPAQSGGRSWKLFNWRKKESASAAPAASPKADAVKKETTPPGEKKKAVPPAHTGLETPQAGESEPIRVDTTSSPSVQEIKTRIESAEQSKNSHKKTKPEQF